MKYYPYRWVILKFARKNQEPVYKVLAGFQDNLSKIWRLNSGIVQVSEFINRELQVETIEFRGYSGSNYICKPKDEGFSNYTYNIFQEITDKVFVTDTHCVEMIYYEDFKKEFRSDYEKD